MSVIAIVALLALVAITSGTVIVYQREIPHSIRQEYQDQPAAFGSEVPMDGLRGLLVAGNPPNGCSNLTKPPVDNNFTGNWIVLIARYDCSFETKVRNAQLAGYDCAIVHNVNSSDLETMSAKDAYDITIPSVFVNDKAGASLHNFLYNNTEYYILVNSDMPFNINTHLLLPFAVVVVLCLVVILISTIVKCVRDRRRARRHRLPKRSLKKIPTCKFSKVVPYETCAICLDDYQEGDRLRVLPCAHAYHAKCVDPWLTKSRRVCPVCKRRVFAAGEWRPARDHSDSSDTEPLVASQDPDRTTQGGTFEEQRENPFRRAARLMRRLGRRQNDADAEETVASTDEEVDRINNDIDEIADGAGGQGDEDTRPLLPAAVASVAERPRRSRRRRARSANAAPDAAPAPAPAPAAEHSINIERGEIGVAALPAAPLASSTPHHIDL